MTPRRTSGRAGGGAGTLDRRRFGVAERRARLGVRHHLAPAARVDDVVTIAGDLLGLHGTDPATVYLSAGARQRGPSVDAVAAALYERRTLVRMLAMRRTMFVEPVALAPVVQSAASAAVGELERTRLERFVEEKALAPGGQGPAWVDAARAEVLAFLAEAGEATGAEIAKAVPRLATKVNVNPGKKYEADVGTTTRVLNGMSADGLIVRGRPRGSWLSTQYRWAAVGTWLGAPLDHVARTDARVELVRRWLRSYGPAPVADLQWWAGWSKRTVTTLLGEVDAVEVDIEDAGAGVVLADDLEPVPAPAPWAALLPALDPTVMGWAQRDWYLGPHKAPLFDTMGNAGPTVWWDGRIVGGWAMPAAGEVAVRYLEDVGRDVERAVDAEVERVLAVTQDTKVVPRFPTPLEKELRST